MTTQPSLSATEIDFVFEVYTQLEKTGQVPVLTDRVPTLAKNVFVYTASLQAYDYSYSEPKFENFAHVIGRCLDTCTVCFESKHSQPTEEQPEEDLDFPQEGCDYPEQPTHQFEEQDEEEEEEFAEEDAEEEKVVVEELLDQLDGRKEILQAELTKKLEEEERFYEEMERHFGFDLGSSSEEIEESEIEEGEIIASEEVEEPIASEEVEEPEDEEDDDLCVSLAFRCDQKPTPADEPLTSLYCKHCLGPFWNVDGSLRVQRLKLFCGHAMICESCYKGPARGVCPVFGCKATYTDTTIPKFIYFTHLQGVTKEQLYQSTAANGIDLQPNKISSGSLTFFDSKPTSKKRSIVEIVDEPQHSSPISPKRRLDDSSLFVLGHTKAAILQYCNQYNIRAPTSYTKQRLFDTIFDHHHSVDNLTVHLYCQFASMQTSHHDPRLCRTCSNYKILLDF